MHRADTVLETSQAHRGPEAYSVAFLPPEAPDIPFEIRAAWERLDSQNTHVYAMYQSLRWWEHLQATGQGAQTRVAVIGDGRGHVAGIVPMKLGDYPLEFTMGKRTLGKLDVRSAFILGGEPLIPSGSFVHERLFRAIWEHVPEANGIYLKGIPAAGPCWAHLQHGDPDAIVYTERGVRQFYTITLPRTFEDYLAKFKQKKRYNCKRQVSLLREVGGGRLDLVRVDSEAHIPAFLNQAKLVARNSWQHRLASKESDEWEEQPRVEDLARRGYLRCYLLRAGNVPCAYVIGYQTQNVFHYADTGYDERYAQYSPGTVLLYLLIEDLINHRPPQLLNFGIGDSHYKSMFATDRSQEASVLLLRRTASNQVRYASHRAFRTLARSAKTVLPHGLSAGPIAAQALDLFPEV